VETFSHETASSLDPWFFTGFAESAASFTFSRSGRQLAVYFAIKSADGRLLRAIQEFLNGAGRLYPVGKGQMYRVTRRTELQDVVAHFDSFPLQGHKRDTYRLWREMVTLKQAFRRTNNRQQLDELARQLSSQLTSRLD